MTPKQAKQICIEAHKGQWRRPEPFSNLNHVLENHEITQMQRGAIDHIVRQGCKYLMNSHLELFKCQPYSSHPIAVANLLTTDEEKILGYLHDVVEDCEGWELKANYSNKYFWLVSPEGTEYELTYDLYMGLKWLTHQANESYSDYINMIAEQAHKFVIKVKIADITHNLSCNPSEKQKEKYLKSIKILLKGI